VLLRSSTLFDLTDLPMVTLLIERGLQKKGLLQDNQELRTFVTISSDHVALFT